MTISTGITWHAVARREHVPAAIQLTESNVRDVCDNIINLMADKNAAMVTHYGSMAFRETVLNIAGDECNQKARVGDWVVIEYGELLVFRDEDFKMRFEVRTDDVHSQGE